MALLRKAITEERVQVLAPGNLVEAVEVAQSEELAQELSVEAEGQGLHLLYQEHPLFMQVVAEAE